MWIQHIPSRRKHLGLMLDILDDRLKVLITHWQNVLLYKATVRPVWLKGVQLVCVPKHLTLRIYIDVLIKFCELIKLILLILVVYSKYNNTTRYFFCFYQRIN